MKTKGSKLFFQGEFFLAEKELKKEKNYKLLAYMYKLQKKFEQSLEYYARIEVITKRDLIRAGECFKKLGKEELGKICFSISNHSINQKIFHKKFGYGILENRKENIVEIVFPLRSGDRKITRLDIRRKEQDGWWEI